MLFRISCFLFIINVSIGQSSFDFIKENIDFLTQDNLNGRGLKGSGIKKSTDFIIKSFIKSGVKPVFAKKSYLQNFQLPDSLLDYKGIVSQNIIGFIKAKSKSDSTIIIGAHYDHLDSCSNLSKEIFPLKRCLVHNGADDNASGVAMALELAK